MTEHSLLCPDPKMIEFAPLFKFTCTGTLMTTLPPPLSGWSTSTLGPPFTLASQTEVSSELVWHGTLVLT